jgi:3-hydroxyisobutyrate dehydrogenase
MTNADSFGAVAVLGAGGTMGQGMARNAAAAGIPVRAWNRTASRLGDLAAEDAVTAFETAREAAAGAAVVVTMLSDADATLTAMEGGDGAIAGSVDGVVWVQMGTIGLDGTERCAALAREHGLAFVDAPVLGTKKPAEDGQLVILASGPEDQRSRLAPLFDAIGKRTMWLGEAGQASRLKVVVNSWIVTVTEGAAELLRLAESLGLDKGLPLEAIEGGPLDQPYMRIKAEAMIAGDYTPSFRLALAAKDARLAVEAGAGAGAEIPMIEAIARQMQAVAERHGDEDLAALYLGREDPA